MYLKERSCGPFSSLPNKNKKELHEQTTEEEKKQQFTKLRSPICVKDDLLYSFPANTSILGLQSSFAWLQLKIILIYLTLGLVPPLSSSSVSSPLKRSLIWLAGHWTAVLHITIWRLSAVTRIIESQVCVYNEGVKHKARGPEMACQKLQFAPLCDFRRCPGFKFLDFEINFTLVLNMFLLLMTQREKQREHWFVFSINFIFQMLYIVGS